ncbi:MAG: PAS domain-containing protein [Rhodospirillales bacterium]|nr:PAS domain-containing protein [Rhodospirillales bacterium]MBT4041475.1 PAS domain-containing protein [Rhodospirillales bacterium]MBT6109259.1 PAS domain-containing protein [Rhodospirillales bacterium]
MGNYINLPLFFSVSFIFGSVAALMAVRLLGVLPGTLVAAIGGSYTWILWGHPYAMIIFTLEALVVGLLLLRIEKIALADTLFWVFIGSPLVFLFYRVQMGMPESAVALIAIKQPVNGIFNAVLAAVILMAARSWLSRLGAVAQSRIQVSSLVFNVLLFVTLTAGTVPVISNSYQVLAEEELTIKHKLEDAAQWISALLQAGSDRSDIVQSVERVAAAMPDKDMFHFALLGPGDVELARYGQLKSLDENGSLREGEQGLTIWQPDGAMATMLRWRDSRYIHRLRLEHTEPDLTLLLETDASFVIEKMDSQHFQSLVYITTLIGIAVALSLALSYLVTRPVMALAALGTRIANHVVEAPIENVKFPESFVREYDDLARSLKNMTGDMAKSYGELRSIKENLEETVEERTKELRHLSMVASQTTNGVIITDAQGVTTWVNDGFVGISGYAADEIIGKRPGDLLQGPGTDPESVAEMRQAVADGAPFNVEIINYSKSGTPYWIEIMCNPFKDEHGRHIGFISIETDISERKNIERVKNEFIATVSHELRTPLTSIKGSIGLLRSGKITELPDQAQSLVDMAFKNINHLGALVDDILDIEKLGTDQMTFDFQPADLTALVRESVASNQSYADEYGVHFQMDGTQDIQVKCDSRRMSQVVANLLSNAAKFSHRGGTVKISAHRQDGMARLSVSDQGVGIPEEFHENIFERFTQSDSSDSRKVGGSGLGLNISKNIVEKHGGTIGFDSTPGVGTTFHVDLPVL